MHLAVLSSTTIKVSWLEPIKIHEKLKGYVVSYGIARDDLNEAVYTTSTQYLMTSLEEFSDYYVQVYVVSESVSGKRSVVQQARTLEDGENCEL